MIILNVPYAEKDQARELGARWEPKIKKWYVPDGVVSTPFELWMPEVPISPGTMYANAPSTKAKRAKADAMKPITAQVHVGTGTSDAPRVASPRPAGKPLPWE